MYLFTVSQTNLARKYMAIFHFLMRTDLLSLNFFFGRFMFDEHLQFVLIVAVEYNVFPMSASLCFPSSEAAAVENVRISSNLRFWSGEL